MFRFRKAALVGALALGSLFVSAPPASAGVVVRGGFYGRGFYGRGWYGGWGWGPAWYGSGWYGPYWGGYYYGPTDGKVKIVTADKDASVYVDGGYAGTAAKMKKFSLRPGAHDLELRDPSGHEFYKQRVEVIRGRTTEIHANL